MQSALEREDMWTWQKRNREQRCSQFDKCTANKIPNSKLHFYEWTKKVQTFTVRLCVFFPCRVLLAIIHLSCMRFSLGGLVIHIKLLPLLLLMVAAFRVTDRFRFLVDVCSTPIRFFLHPSIWLNNSDLIVNTYWWNWNYAPSVRIIKRKWKLTLFVREDNEIAFKRHPNNRPKKKYVERVQAS